MVNTIGFENYFFIDYFIEDPYADFKEADINFAPTYKFDLRSNSDTYNKHRTPSYTVRIKIENTTEKYSIRDEIVL
jgi:hypothetical protein